VPLSPAQFEQRLKGDPLAPVWLIASSEPLLLLEACDALRARARALGYSEREVFDADARFDWDQLAASGAALSLFATRRLLEVRLPTGKPGKEGGAAIEAFCRQPPPDVMLLVAAGDWSRGHEGGWSRAIESAGHAVVLWPPKPHELPAWIAARLRSRGIEATPDAVELLAARIEGNLLAAAQEVDKLALLLGGGSVDAGRSRHPASRDTGPSLDVAGIESLVADCARFDVFRLADTALAGDAPRALRMLAGLRAEGEQPVAVLSWLASQVQVLALLAATQEAGGNLAQAMTAARVWDSKQPLFKRALARGSAAQFERLLADCARIDRIGKGRAHGDAWVELERLTVGIAAPRALPRRA
jgi:DNA polymerase-3 subunit delta